MILRITRPVARHTRLYSSSSFSDVEHIIEGSLDKTTHRTRGSGTPLTTTRREALSLYREIMRITALFDWPNEQGVIWRDVLRHSARQEFEDARHEQDPEVVNRLLVVGRDAVGRISERFIDELKKKGTQ
jgi:hypothetical protein